MSNLDFNIDNLVRDNVKNLKPYSSARDEYISDGSRKIFMDANESPFDNGLNRYPDPQQRLLKKKIADRFDMATSQILLGNGSDEVLDLIFRGFCEPGSDNIITMPPTYGMYKVLAGVNDIENREVCLTTEFELDLEAIFSQVDENTKLIMLCSPNNPTGNRFSDDDLKSLLTQFRGLLVLDEAYIDFSDKASWVSQIKEYPNLIVTQTLSKAYGMAGIRLGICYASESIIEILNRIKPPYNINQLSQQSAMKRLESVDVIADQVSEILREREKLIVQLGEIPFIEKIYPSDANFVLVRVDDADRRYSQILNRGVVVRNRSNLPLCENTLRFTVGTAEENRQLIQILKSI